MRAFAILLVASCLTWSALPRPALAAPDEKALQRAMEQQRKAAEAEMRRQAEYEKKVMEQQQRAMQEEMKTQQRYMQMQQKAMQHQQQEAAKQIQNATKQAQHANAPHVTTTGTSTPTYHAARPYYGHLSSSHAYHRPSTYHYRQTSNQLDPQTRALQRLKHSLDSVRMTSGVTSGEKTAIKRALMGVVMVPRVPSVTTIDQLAGHLASGLSNRGSANAQTGPMAMTLMGVMNSSEMANSDLTEVMNEHRAALKVSKVQPTHITPIMESLKTISNQERGRH